MSYDLYIKTEADHIRVEVAGKRIPGQEVGNAIDAWKKVVQESRKTSLNRILVIGKVPGRVSASAAHLIATTAEEVESSKEFRIAMVFSDHESLISHNLTKTFATNLGYEVNVFGNEDEAIEWLLEE